MTLSELEQVVANIPAETLASLLNDSLTLVTISNQQTKVDKMITARDATVAELNAAIAVEQAILDGMRAAQKQ